MSAVHYAFPIGSDPLCGERRWYAKAERAEDVTCKHCLRKMAQVVSN